MTLRAEAVVGVACLLWASGTACSGRAAGDESQDADPQGSDGSEGTNGDGDGDGDGDGAPLDDLGEETGTDDYEDCVEADPDQREYLGFDSETWREQEWGDDANSVLLYDADCTSSADGWQVMEGYATLALECTDLDTENVFSDAELRVIPESLAQKLDYLAGSELAVSFHDGSWWAFEGIITRILTLRDAQGDLLVTSLHDLTIGPPVDVGVPPPIEGEGFNPGSYLSDVPDGWLDPLGPMTHREGYCPWEEGGFVAGRTQRLALEITGDDESVVLLDGEGSESTLEVGGRPFHLYVANLAKPQTHGRGDNDYALVETTVVARSVDP